MNPLIVGALKSMNPDERMFACYVASGLSYPKSYRQAFPALCFDFELVDEAGSYKPKLSDKVVTLRANKLSKREDVARYIDFLRQSEHNPKILADAVVAEQMIAGTAAQRFDAAKLTLSRDEKSATRRTIETYIEILKEIGAEVVVPVLPGAEAARISVHDLIEGRAQIFFPKAARVKLLERAGFPFNSSIRQTADGREEKWPLSDLQLEFLFREERFLLLHGGSGLGKSVLGAAFAFQHLMIPGHKAAIVGATYDLCSNEYEYVFQAFENLFGRDGAVRMVNLNTPHNHDMEIQTYWNSHCTTYSLQHEEGARILGKEFDIIVVGEGSHVPIGYWEKRCLRALDRRIGKYGHIYETGRGVCFTTPKGFEGMSSAIFDRVNDETKNRPHLMHVGGVWPSGVPVSWHETVYLREANVLENPSYSREVYAARKRSLTTEAFQEQYQGLRVSRSGLVVKEYDRTRHLIELPKPKQISQMRLGVGIDTGKFFAATLWGIGQDKKIYGIGEVYTEELSISDNCKDVREMICDVLGPVHGLPAPHGDDEIAKMFARLADSIDIWRVDPASQHKEDLVEHLDIPLGAEKLELLASIDDLREFFKSDMLFVSDTMERTDWELSRYRWVRRKDAAAQFRAGAQQPERANDHCIDSARFVVPELQKSGPLELEPVSTTFEENYDAQRRFEVVGNLFAQLREPTQVTAASEFFALHGGS